MAEPLGQMIIELGLDSSSFGKGLAGVRKETKYAMSEMKSNMAVLGQTGNALDKLGAKQTGLTKVLSAQKREVNELKKAYEGSLVNGKPTAQTAKLATQLQNANAKVAGLNSQLINNARQMAITETRTIGWTGNLNKMSSAAIKNGKTMASMGAAASKYVSIPLGAAIVGSVKAASDFDSAFTGVKKTVDEAKDANGKTIISYKDLENGIRKMAKSIPVSATEISHVAEAAGQLGIKTKNVLSFSKTMVAMGKATNLTSEDASVALAKLANITGMPQKNFDRLGSSIVNLGNNMATTESDIVEMSLRLAGSGHQVGMTESQITGLAAAMSSVGINAEAGGGSMSRVMQKINTSVMSGNKSLAKFASVSGMSAEQFQKNWKEDSSQAIVSFVKGLGKAKASGKDVTSMLKDMGISSTQELDTMLRLSGAGGTLAKALKISGQGWQENTALTQEAEKRYATFESKLQLVKNKLTDVGITVGGPFMSAFSDAIDAAEPAIKTVERLSKAFSDADPKTQTMIVNMGLLAVAGGPVLGVVGKLTTGVGTLGRGFVDLVGKIRAGQAATEMTASLLGNVGTGSAAAAGGLAKMGPATLEASQGAELLAFKMGSAGQASTGLAAAMGPVGLAVLGTVAVVGLGVAAWELWGKSAVESAERTARWGTDVGAAADQSLTKMQNFSSNVQNQLDGFASKSDSTTKAVASNFNGMYKQLESDSKKSFKKLQKDIDDLPTFAKSAATKDLAEKKKTNAAVVADAKNQNKIVQSVLKQHNGDVASLSDDERQIVLNARTRITADELKLLQINGKAKKVVLQTLNGDISRLSQQQRNQDVQDLSSQYTKEKKIYESQSASIKKAYKDGAISADTYKKSMKELESSHKSSVDNMAAATLKLDRANGKSKDEIMQDLGVYETSYKRAAEIVDGQSKKMSKSTSLIAADTADMSKKTAKANEQWNNLIFDPKTGKVKTNAQEEVTKAAQSEKGWDALKYDLKNANLSSNAKLMIGEAAVQNGKWQDLTWKEKEAILTVKGKQGMVDVIKEFGIWDQLSLKDQEAVINGDPKPIAEMLLKGGQWNDLTLKQQKALVVTNAGEKLMEGLQANGNWDALDFKTKQAIIESNSTDEIRKALVDSGQWNAMSFDKQELLVENKASKKIMEALNDAGTWNKLDVKTQQAVIESKGLPQLADSVIQMQNWNELPADIKKLLVNNDEAKQKLIDAGVDITKYDNQKPLPKKLIADADDYNQVLESSGLKIDLLNGKDLNTKYLNANNESFIKSVTQSNGLIVEYNSINPELKQLLAENGDVVGKLTTSESVMKEYNSLSPDMKKLIADTYGFDVQLDASTGKVKTLNATNTTPKQPIALTDPFNANMQYSTEMTRQLDRTNPSPKMPTTFNGPFDGAFSGSIGWMNQYNSIFPNAKQPLAYTDAFNNGFSGSIGWMNQYNATNPGGKTASVDSSSVSNAKGVFSDFMFSWNREKPVLSKSIMFDVTTNKHARGTNASPGGLSILGDGGRPEPYYMPKSGLFGISPAKDTPYMLEKGTKVWPSISKFMRDMPSMAPQMLNALPHFAKGTPDIPADAEILRNINRAQTALTNQTINISSPNNDAVIRNQEVQIKIQQSQLDILHTLLNALTNQEPSSNLDLKQLAKMINAMNQQSKQIIKYNNG